MAILFCHGLESGPVGRKSLALQRAGLEVIAPDCRGLDLGARVRLYRDALLAAELPPLLVGSSFGGIAGLLAALGAVQLGVVVPALVLLAPALQVPLGADARSLAPPAATVIVHGTEDSVIPIEISRRFAEQHGVRLIEVDDDHRLAGSIPLIVELVVEAARAGGCSFG